QPQQIRIDVVPLADDPDADTIPVQIDQVLAHEPLHHAHQLVDLVGGARPVLRRERIDREILDTEVDGCSDRPPQRLDTHPVANRARQATAARPAAVAVHYDGNVARRRTAVARIGDWLYLNVCHRPR